MPTIKKHNNRRTVPQRTAEETTHRNNEDRNAPITAAENQPITPEHLAQKVKRNQSTSSSDEVAVCSRKVAIYITKDHIVRQTRILYLFKTRFTPAKHEPILIVPIPILNKSHGGLAGQRVSPVESRYLRQVLRVLLIDCFEFCFCATETGKVLN